MTTVEISSGQLIAGYGLLLFPIVIFLWHSVPLLSSTFTSVLRMTVQLLFIGFYLEYLFLWNNIWLNAAWIAVMVLVADASIVKGCGLRLRLFWFPLALALSVGVLIPLFFLVLMIIRPAPLFDARYVVPIAGMILGNCLRADIVGIHGFYNALRKNEKVYFHSLSCGARLREAIHPFLREALNAALAPTIATMATMGVVSLPGMMTGVILGGADPVTAIKYQIAIMLAIFSGTAITVTVGIYLTLPISFTAFGILKHEIFAANNR
ncbi:MAG: ABC transporter permease [Candidatus Hydrogenedentales bacterium]